ncbi:hypothetical protein M404DRAFT_25887 [Pisolithus tinctorius Marx 270]|uniref:Uncharacterized protein n=1 Tax=Pisolithus tinctorius Marx 270 TaxID=870435 RepID=A0A0C3J6X9_PISTI|nr:hypothetical protein M404DRAFT_25887 [Pisolithus tinctorius Marx 270]
MATRHSACRYRSSYCRNFDDFTASLELVSPYPNAIFGLTTSPPWVSQAQWHLRTACMLLRFSERTSNVPNGVTRYEEIKAYRENEKHELQYAVERALSHNYEVRRL